MLPHQVRFEFTINSADIHSFNHSPIIAIDIIDESVDGCISTLHAEKKIAKSEGQADWWDLLDSRIFLMFYHNCHLIKCQGFD